MPIGRRNVGGTLMSEPWFDPDFYAWIPGTVLGTPGGSWGASWERSLPGGRGNPSY